MAFTLSYSVTERNDNKLLTVTDTSGEVATGTATGWGAPNPEYATIDGVTVTLELDITITTSDGTSTTYDTIDLYTEFAPIGGFATITDLVFPLDCSMLTSSGVALGTSDDVFPDGIYEFTYTHDDGAATYTTTSELIYGNVKNAVYELLRTIPAMYECGAAHEKSTLDILFMRMYLNTLIISTLAGREDSVLTQLGVLEDLLNTNGAYTW